MTDCLKNPMSNRVTSSNFQGSAFCQSNFMKAGRKLTPPPPPPTKKTYRLKKPSLNIKNVRTSIGSESPSLSYLTQILCLKKNESSIDLNMIVLSEGSIKQVVCVI